MHREFLMGNEAMAVGALAAERRVGRGCGRGCRRGWVRSYELDHGPTARLELDLGSTARLELDLGSTARLELDRGSESVTLSESPRLSSREVTLWARIV